MTDTDTAVVDPEADANTDEVTEVDTPSASEAPAPAMAQSLDSFWAAVSALDPTNPNYDNALAEYDKLERGAKMKANHGVKGRVFTALDEDNFALGKVLSGLTKAIAAFTGSGPADADPTEELVQRMGGLYIAYNELQKANPSLAERVKAAVEAGNKDGDFKAEKPVSISGALAKRLIETKMGRKPREGSGTRHSPAKHIEQVFADLSDGTFLTLKQIADAKSDEYGDDSATVASIEMNLKSGKFDVAGLEIVSETKGEGEDAKTKITGVRKGALPDA